MGPTREQAKNSARYHKPGSADVTTTLDAIRDWHEAAIDFMYDFIPESRERSIALAKLEEWAMYAIKARVINPG